MGFIIFLLWIGLSIAVGMFASIRRNRSGWGWFLLPALVSLLLAFIFYVFSRLVLVWLALLISPLVAFVFCAILKPKPEPRREETINEDAVKLARAFLEKMPDQTWREETSDPAKVARTILEKKPERIRPTPTVAARWPENGRRPP
jgi:uncharacterized membrane protein YccC